MVRTLLLFLSPFVKILTCFFYILKLGHLKIRTSVEFVSDFKMPASSPTKRENLLMSTSVCWLFTKNVRTAYCTVETEIRNQRICMFIYFCIAVKVLIFLCKCRRSIPAHSSPGRNTGIFLATG